MNRSRIHRSFWLVPLACALTLPVWAAPRRAPRGWKNYDGPWFSVFYPATWKATPGKTPALSGGGKSDGAFFTSPDGRAQFALYSPQWNGNPSDLAIDPRREKQVSSLTVPTTTKDKLHLRTETRWRTFRALNGGYTRSIVDVENVTLGSRRVFGFRYRDSATYKKYLPQFQKFKSSLEQYAD